MTDEPEFRWRDCPKYAWNFVCIAVLKLQTRWADFRCARARRRLEEGEVEIARRVAHLPREERWKFYADMDAEIAEVRARPGSGKDREHVSNE